MPSTDRPIRAETRLQTGATASHFQINSRSPTWLWSWVLPSLVVATLLLFWQRDILRLPPWQDQAVGLWNEADFLATSQFAYCRLLYEEHHFMDSEPGPRSYMISVMPTLLALGMLTVPVVETLVVIVRVLTFLFGALLLVGLTHVISASGVPRWLAIMFCTALATTPLFVVQLDAMGMDVPLTVIMLANAALLWRQRWQAAALVSLTAFAIKATGQLMTLGGIAYLALRLVCGWRSATTIERRGMIWGLTTHFVVLLVQTALIRWGDTSVQYLTAGDWPENLLTINSLPTNTPDVAVLIGVGLALAAWQFVTSLGASWRARMPTGGSAVAVVRHLVLDEPQLLLSWILVIGLLSASWQFIYTPRYVFCVMPFLYIALARPWLGTTAIRRFSTAGALALLIACNLINQEGRLCADLMQSRGADVFDKIPGITPRLCAYVERSREYLHDHRSNIAAFALIETKYADHPIFVASGNMFLASRPRLGHVHRPLEVYDASLWIKALNGFREVMLRPAPAGGRRDPIFIRFAHARVTLPPFEPGDELIFDDSDINPDAPLVIYIKHLPEDLKRTARAIEDWYISHTWSADFVLARVRERPEYLMTTGRVDRALAELDEAHAWEPEDLEVAAIREHWRRQASEYRGATRN